MTDTPTKRDIIFNAVKSTPGIRFYAIARLLINAGHYTGKDLGEREAVNADITAVVNAGEIRWDDEAGGFVVC